MVDVYEFESVKSCMDYVRSKGYKKIWQPKWMLNPKILYDIDTTDQVALYLAMNISGVSDETAGLCRWKFSYSSNGYGFKA